MLWRDTLEVEKNALKTMLSQNNPDKRLLLISYLFPPLGSPRSFRWLNLTKELMKKGWSIHVLTIYPSRNDSYFDPELINDMPSKIQVFRTFPGMFYRFIHIRKRPVRGFLKFTWEWFPFGFIKGLKLVMKEKYPLMISTGLPFVSHLLAFFIQRKQNPIWVMDMGDSLGFNPNTCRLKKILGSFLENKFLQRARAVIVPFKEMKKDIIRHYPHINQNKIHTIRHGISALFFNVEPEKKNSKFVISYTGSFYKQIHDPAQFFLALASLKSRTDVMRDLECVIAGNTETEFIRLARKLHLGERIKFLGQVSHRKAVSLIKGSSVNLYLGGDRPDNHFPYKILEYAASGRPVLALEQSRSDYGARYIKEKQIGLVINNGWRDIRSSIIQLHSLWKEERLHNTFHHLHPDDMSWEKRGDELIRLFRNMQKNQVNKVNISHLKREDT
jgi:glycosyltransferase involved in cell wall biosynthesis